MKIFFFTFSLDYEMLSSILSMLQRSKLLWPTVKEKIQLQETTLTNVSAHAWTDGRTDSDGPTLVRN